jgi:1,2-diacylglycerol 3-beta-glucosyltransferase
LYPNKNNTIYNFTILVPCHNEELVIKNTLEKVVKQFYRMDKFDVMVINDGSTDQTKHIVEQFILDNPYNKIKLVNVPLNQSKRGKANALNYGYKFIEKKESHILGIIDADGWMDKDLLHHVNNEFKHLSVGAVNASIRMRNNDSILTMGQHIEFSVILRFLNVARGYLFGSAFLGGNGQFMRMSVLEELLEQSEQPEQSNVGIWDNNALTEDLDLGLRIQKNGHRIHQLLNTFVSQQAPINLNKLIKQRNRWGWGLSQIYFKYVLNIKLLSNYKTISTGITVGILDSFNTLNSIFFASVFGVLTVLTIFFVNDYTIIFISCLLWIIIPLTGLLIDTESRKNIFSNLIKYHIYVIMIIPTMFVGLYRVITKQKVEWDKTERIEE